MLHKLHVLIGALLFTPALVAQSAKRFDIVINELFPDPTPVVGLPGSEFIELKNTAATGFSLLGFKLSDGTSTATITADFILQPDSFVIICAVSASPAFSAFGKTIGVSNFPSLNNDGDAISLSAPGGTIIHTIAYSTNWYGNAIKEQGGWTLELIDAKNPCNGSNNWTASTDNSGGTPGRKNAVAGHNPDNTPPALLRTYLTDSLTLVAVFDESLDSAQAASAFAYTINPGIGHPVTAIPLLPIGNEVMLRLATPLQTSTVYELTVKNISDCAGNFIGMLNKTKVGWPQPGNYFDIVINELLFNPPPGGYDYVELYNRSHKTVDLKQLYIANKNATGSITNIKSLSENNRLLYPGEYIVISESRQWTQQHYMVKDQWLLTELPALPSMPDDKGSIVITNMQGVVLDELQYDAKWHFALVDNEDGIALERINYNDSTQRAGNWTSAASTSNFGTPGYQNSQFRADLQVQGQITVTPKIFSPDNNGFDDFATLQYQMSEPGYVANITIFDAGGRPVRYLTRNAILGIKGQFRWDGLDDKSNKLPIGIYIIFTEIFNLQGKTRKFKNTVTMARPY
jgi:hypothetical protein